MKGKQIEFKRKYQPYLIQQPKLIPYEFSFINFVLILMDKTYYPMIIQGNINDQLVIILFIAHSLRIDVNKELLDYRQARYFMS